MHFKSPARRLGREMWFWYRFISFWLIIGLKLKISEDEARACKTENWFVFDEEFEELKLAVFKFISNKYDEVVEL